MIATLFYLYGIIYIIRDILETRYFVMTNTYEQTEEHADEIQDALLRKDWDKAKEFDDKSEGETKWYDVGLSLISATWIIIGLNTDLWLHFLFLILITPATFLLKFFNPKSISKVTHFKICDAINCAFRIVVLAIIYYKHFII